jgi:acetylornithine deacetylase/succinyl-diaminopimelate desuccinylase-like protein
MLNFVLAVQADTTPFTHGSNDNASGVAVGLELASRLAQSPLNNHDVTLAFTGCGETGGYGADAFLREKGATLSNAIHLVIAHVGGKDAALCFIRSEQLWRPAPSNLGLLNIADNIIATHPELNAHTRSVQGAASELSIGAKHGLRTIGLFGLTQDGAVPHQHQPTDTTENVDVDAAVQAAELAWRFLQVVDEKFVVREA